MLAPNAFGPSAAGLEAVGPDAFGPGASGLEALAPGAFGPGAAGLEALAPGAFGPGASGLEALAPGAFGPAALGPPKLLSHPCGSTACRINVARRSRSPGEVFSTTNKRASGCSRIRCLHHPAMLSSSSNS